MNDQQNEKILAIVQKEAVLEQAKVQLKREYVGIDDTIDSIVQSIRPWYCLPELQTRPIIVNLWGLTGVGKTTLVARLVELIGCHDSFFRFDLGDRDGCYSFYRNYEKLVEMDMRRPIVIAFDEFQHARTKDEDGREIRRDESRMLWEIIDAGRVRIFQWSHTGERLFWLADKLDSLIERGVVIERGVITHGRKMAEMELEIAQRTFSFKQLESFVNGEKPKQKPKPVKPLCVSESHMDDIIQLAGKRLNLLLKSDVENHLRTLDGPQLVTFLRKVAESGSQTIEKQFPQMLVFVMGNLDEAFTMNDEIGADEDADWFYEKSLKIGIPEVKKALQKRFRNEQIARLGNTHIVYPAIRRAIFEEVISRQLMKLSESVEAHTGIRLTIDASVHRLVYAEGVYPMQGFRPIFSTIHQLITSSVGTLVSEVCLKHPTTREMRVEYADHQLIASFQREGGETEKTAVCRFSLLNPIFFSRCFTSMAEVVC